MNTLGVVDAPAGGNKGHLEYIKTKSATWINRMKNGHLPSHIAWVAYRLQLWASLRYWIGTPTNDIEEAEEVHQRQDREMLNILGIVKKRDERTETSTTYFRRFWNTQPCHRATDRKTQPVATALPHPI